MNNLLHNPIVYHSSRASAFKNKFCFNASFTLLNRRLLTLSPLRKVSILIKRIVLDEIFIFRDLLMPEYQRIEKNENISERNFFDFQTFRSGLNL